MKKWMVLVMLVVFCTATLGMAAGNSADPPGPAPNSGDGISDSHGPAPNSGDGDPDGSGMDGHNGPNG